MPLELPTQSFDAIAVDLFLYANSGAQAVAAGEVMMARGGWAGGFNHTLEELRTAAILSGKLHAFFRAAAPHEAEIRAFLATLDVGDQDEAAA